MSSAPSQPPSTRTHNIVFEHFSPALVMTQFHVKLESNAYIISVTLLIYRNECSRAIDVDLGLSACCFEASVGGYGTAQLHSKCLATWMVSLQHELGAAKQLHERLHGAGVVQQQSWEAQKLFVRTRSAVHWHF